TTLWAVSPGGSFSTTNSWMIGNASSLMNVTSNGWFAGTVVGMPWKVKFLTETLYIVAADPGAATSAVLDAVNGAHMPSATCGGRGRTGDGGRSRRRTGRRQRRRCGRRWCDGGLRPPPPPPTVTRRYGERHRRCPGRGRRGEGRPRTPEGWRGGRTGDSEE